MPAPAAREKRIVFTDRDGQAHILGTDAKLASLPVTAEDFPLRDRVVPFASLVRVTPRAAYYVEPMAPASRTFHEQQR